MHGFSHSSKAQSSASLSIGLALLAGIILGATMMLLAQLQPSPFAQFSSQCAQKVTPLFSPSADEEFLTQVQSARETIEIELYQFSFPQLKQALVDAASRGVRVRIILEPSVDSNYATAKELDQGGVQVRWGRKDVSKTHSKFAVLDGVKVIVGSHNWSMHAMKLNREASVIVESPQAAADFLQVFEDDWQHASEYKKG